MNGNVVSIHIAPKEGAPVQSLQSVRAVAGKGLEGDRNFQDGAGEHRPDREITLIEIEAIEALKRDTGLDLAPGDARRNVVTRGIALNDLIDREFTVGAVRLRGLKLSEPCNDLARMTDERVLKGLLHRGGVRAQILESGMIAVGDAVTVDEPVGATGA